MSSTPVAPATRTGAGSSATDLRALTLARVRSGAMWFTIIAIVSGMNSLLQIFGARIGSATNIHFIFGLGITQVADAIAKQSSNGTAILLVCDGIFLGLLLLFGMWARQRSQAAFIAGMIVYALDGVLLLRYGVWLDAAVHAYALFRMWQGFAACRELAEIDRAVQPGLAPVNLR